MWKLTATPDMVTDDDGRFIPRDPMNSDWQSYEAWVAAGNTPEAYVAPPAPVPETISDRQFFQQLALSGVIAKADALAAVKTGEVPVALRAFIEALPPAQQFDAEMLLSGATAFERNHPLTNAIGAAQGMTPDQVDQFFRDAAAL